MGCINIEEITTECNKIFTCDEVPDPNYNFLVKRDEQKDGLDVYRPTSAVEYNSQIKCPLCKCRLPQEERYKISDILKASGEAKLNQLFNKYNREADADNTIDNIKDLEAIYNEIQETIKNAEEKRYYKHTCTRNDICKRTQNQDVYIDLCFEEPNKDIDKNLKVDLKKLKTDENYRNKYLSDKKIAYQKYVIRQKIAQIEREYRDEFEEMTFKKEQNQYEWATRNIKDAYRRHCEFEDRKGPMDIRFEFPASQEWYKEKGTFKYSGTKKRLKEFIEDLTGKSINDNVSMGNSEYKEFQKYIIEREPEYAELLNSKDD